MPTLDDYVKIGFKYHQDNKYEEAENAYTEALKIDGENAEVCILMGVLKLQKNEVREAILWIEKAIKKDPCEYFYESLFHALMRNKYFSEIISYEKEVLHNYPKSFSLLFYLAQAFKNLGKNLKAINLYDKALKIKPDSMQAWYNISHLYSIEAQCKNAVSALEICKKLSPYDKEVDYFLATAYMRIKDYNKGLKLFESRMCRDTALSTQSKMYPNLIREDNLWKGENIKDKTIFVYYEAGYGDVIMFSRYLPLLKKKCKKLIFYPHKQLVPLFQHSNLGIDELVEGFVPENKLSFDVHVPLLSLPYLLGLKNEEIFEQSEGYLVAEEKLVENYQKKYFDNDALKIGFKWQGNTTIDKDRVIPVKEFFPLMELEKTKFYSFQTFEGAENIENIPDKYNVVDIGKDLLNFDQTAAALMGLDLVICNDTSLAHLAGALGIPCFVLLPYEVNWRWHDDLPRCDWYNSLTLFRQKENGNWDKAIQEILEILNNHISSGNIQ